MRNIILGLSLILSNSALAQDSVNSHGLHLVPNDGDVGDGIGTWVSESHEKGAFTGNALFEYGSEPLTLYKSDNSGTVSSDIIDSYTALNLGLFYSPSERLSLTASAPLFLSVDGAVPKQGVGLGDLRFASSVGLLLPEHTDTAFGVSIVPFLDVPGTYGDSQLGLSGVAGGGLVSTSVYHGRLMGTVNAGVEFTPKVEYYNLQGGERFTGSLMGAVVVQEDLALRGEVFYNPAFYKNAERGTDTPVEAMLSLRGQTGDNLSWTVGGSSALNKSVGPVWRAFAGVDLAFGARKSKECPSCEGVILSGVGVTNTDGDFIDGGQVLVVNAEGQIGDITGQTVTLPPRSILGVGCVVPESLVIVTDNELLLLEPIYFDFDKATIRFPESSDILDALVSTLKSHTELSLVEVGGHTDERGSHAYNETLSQARVQSVVDYLVENGISEDRLRPVGYGERVLLSDCVSGDEACHQRNRRVQFTILERD